MFRAAVDAAELTAAPACLCGKRLDQETNENYRPLSGQVAHPTSSEAVRDRATTVCAPALHTHLPAAPTTKEPDAFSEETGGSHAEGQTGYPCSFSPEAADQGRGPLVLDCPFLCRFPEFFFLEYALYVLTAARSSCSDHQPILSPVVPGTHPALLTSLSASIGGTSPPYKNSPLRRPWSTGHLVTL